MERSGTSAIDVLLGSVRVDSFSSREHWDGLGVFPRDVAVWDIACELSVLHLARNVADEFVHCHYVGGGMATTRKRAWIEL